MNRPLFDRALSLLGRFRNSQFHSVKGRNKTRTGRRFSFEVCEDRSMLAGASITGIKYETIKSSGFSPTDIPWPATAPTVFVDLFKDTVNLGVFDPNADMLAQQVMVTPGTGVYTFNNVQPGHYFIQEEVPTGFIQSAGPAFYTVDVVGDKVFTGSTQDIDEFVDTMGQKQFVITATTSPSTVFNSTDAGADILGGQRNLQVIPLTFPGVASAGGVYGSGSFFLNTDTSDPGTEVLMNYDATNGGMPPADLTAGGATGIRLNFRFLQWLQSGSGNSADLRITVNSPGGGTATYSMPFTQHPAQPFSVFVPFSSFTPSGNFNFNNVSTVQVTYNQNGLPAFDFEVTQIVADHSFDFGNFPILSLSGCKYVDSNNNASKDPGELPIQGVEIVLTGTDDLGNPVNLMTTTDANGMYQFQTTQNGVDSLRPSFPGTTYTVTEIPPVNFIIGKPNAPGTGMNMNGQSVTINKVPTFTGIKAVGGDHGVNFNFGELGLTPPYVSKRMLLFPAQQPVVLMAVYPDMVTTESVAVKPATTAAAKVVAPVKKMVVPAKKPAPKPAPKPAAKTTVKAPVYTTVKKK